MCVVIILIRLILFDWMLVFVNLSDFRVIMLNVSGMKCEVLNLFKLGIGFGVNRDEIGEIVY